MASEVPISALEKELPCAQLSVPPLPEVDNTQQQIETCDKNANNEDAPHHMSYMSQQVVNPGDIQLDELHSNDVDILNVLELSDGRADIFRDGLRSLLAKGQKKELITLSTSELL